MSDLITHVRIKGERSIDWHLIQRPSQTYCGLDVVDAIAWDTSPFIKSTCCEKCFEAYEQHRAQKDQDGES